MCRWEIPVVLAINFIDWLLWCIYQGKPETMRRDRLARRAQSLLQYPKRSDRSSNLVSIGTFWVITELKLKLCYPLIGIRENAPLPTTFCGTSFVIVKASYASFECIFEFSIPENIDMHRGNATIRPVEGEIWAENTTNGRK
jgi:hypothetical protein